ncbi:hypothetical protein JCM3774_006563 [Rhodotorula dairenensis]
MALALESAPSQAATSLAARLREPFASTDDLLRVLVPPLAQLALVHDHPQLVQDYAHAAPAPAPALALDRDRFLRRQIGLVQSAILERVWPDWHRALSSAQAAVVCERYFVPPPDAPAPAPADKAAAAEAADEIALSAYRVLSSYLSPSSRRRLPPHALSFVLDLVAKLSDRFSVEHLYYATIRRRRPGAGSSLADDADPDADADADPVQVQRWEFTLKDMLAIPDRAANAAAVASASASSDGSSSRAVKAVLSDLPPALDPNAYRPALARSYGSLLWRISAASDSPSSPSSCSLSSESHLDALAQPLLALIRSSDPSLLVSTLAQTLIPRFCGDPLQTFPTPSDQLVRARRHNELWQTVVASHLSDRERERFLTEWIRYFVGRGSGSNGLTEATATATARARSRGQAARAIAFVLESIFGPLSPGSGSGSGTDDSQNPDGGSAPIWRTALPVLLSSQTATITTLTTGTGPLPRAVAVWAGTEPARVALLDATSRVWADADEIQLGSESRRLYLTSLLLHLIVSLPVRHRAVVRLSRSLEFLEAVSAHLSLVAAQTRLLGMLVAETVSARTVDPAGRVKPLAFGSEIWDGEDSARVVVRTLRAELTHAEKRDDESGWQDALRSCVEDSTSRPPNAGPGQSRPPPKTSRTVRREGEETLKPTSVEEPPPPPPPLRPKRPLIAVIGEDDDDDDDLEPYHAPPPPPNAAVQAALESDDPALYHSAFPSPSPSAGGTAASQTRKRGRLRPPVYVPELVAYLKGKDPEAAGSGAGVGAGGKEEAADGEAERIEMGLKEGPGLIRRKTGWGGELRENAVDLAFTLMGLQNQFDIDEFDRHKLDMLVALVVACPTEVAPAIIEQYFTDSYSIAQRHALLASLAFAARELAGLPIPTAAGATPEERKQVESPLFPSEQLPPAMHDRLVQQQRQQQNGASDDRLELLAADLTQMALSGARSDAETTIPQAAREQVLSLNRTTRRSAGLAVKSAAATPTTAVTFSTLAAEVFILPLINRFWLYLRDQATAGRAGSSGSYLGGSATPQLLEPILLSRFLATVTVLVHASRHSPAFLAVIVPETLSFVLMLRPAISAGGEGQLPNNSTPATPRDQDLVVASALELALAALDGTVHLDGGRMLMSSSVANGSGGALVTDIKDWAEHVFEQEERKGHGDLAVGRPGRAAAGVLLRIEEILGKWRLSVGW